MSSQIARSAGFQANDIMPGVQDSDTEVQALEAIANLATENVEDKQTIATLAATNASLVADFIQVRSEFTAFHKSARNLNKHYCWTCGTYCDHDSKLCKVNKPGHKNEVTWSDRIRGNYKKFKPKD